MATAEAKKRGFDEGLMIDLNGFVAQGPGANFFYEKDGIFTRHRPETFFRALRAKRCSKSAKSSTFQ